MRNFKYLTILLVITLLSSCMLPEGDCADCSSPKLYFSYKDAAGNDLLNQYVSSATLYFYDNKGKLVNTQEVSEQKIKANDGINLNVLTDGHYRVVAWANVGKNTNMVSTGQLNSAQLSVLSGSSSESADALYYGAQSFMLTSGLNTNIVVDLNSIHVKFTVAVKGLEKVNAPKIVLDNLQSTYNFLGKAIETTSVSQKPIATYDEVKKGYVSSFNFLKPKSKLRDLVLKLSHSQLPVAGLSININEFIQKNYPNVDITDLSKEIKIDMLIEFDGVDVVLTIPDWEDTDTGTEVH